MRVGTQTCQCAFDRLRARRASTHAPAWAPTWSAAARRRRTSPGKHPRRAPPIRSGRPCRRSSAPRHIRRHRRRRALEIEHPPVPFHVGDLPQAGDCTRHRQTGASSKRSTECIIRSRPIDMNNTARRARSIVSFVTLIDGNSAKRARSHAAAPKRANLAPVDRPIRRPAPPPTSRSNESTTPLPGPVRSFHVCIARNKPAR